MMKNLLIILSLFIINSNSFAEVKFVDAEKFSGLWQEIARTYNSFQEDCMDSNVEYILKNKKFWTHCAQGYGFRKKIPRGVISFSPPGIIYIFVIAPCCICITKSAAAWVCMRFGLSACTVGRRAA